MTAPAAPRRVRRHHGGAGVGPSCSTTSSTSPTSSRGDLRGRAGRRRTAPAGESPVRTRLRPGRARRRRPVRRRGQPAAARPRGRLGVERIVWMDQVPRRAPSRARRRRRVTEPVPTADALVTAHAGSRSRCWWPTACRSCPPTRPPGRRRASRRPGRRGRGRGAARGRGAPVRRRATRARSDALLGPAVCGGCYPVPPELRDEVESRLPGARTAPGPARPALDLRAGLAAPARPASACPDRLPTRAAPPRTPSSTATAATAHRPPGRRAPLARALSASRRSAPRRIGA